MLKKIFNIGMQPQMLIFEQRKIRLLNFISFVLVVYQPFAITLYLMEQDVRGVIFSIFDGFAGILVIYLQSQKRYIIARIFIFIYFPISLFIQVLVLKSMELQLFWLLALIGIFFIFDNSRLRKLFFAYIGVLIIISYFYLYGLDLIPYFSEKIIFVMVNTVFITILFVVSTYYFLSFFVQNTEYFQQLTEEKSQEVLRQNEEIQQQADYLNEMNKMKDRLFSIIAHDLRNPVAALRNTIDILDPAILNTEELVHVKTELLRQFDGVDFTLNNLLTWTKTQLKGENLQREKVKIHNIVEGKLNLFAPMLRAKGLHLYNQTLPDTEVYADLNYFRFILRNLIFNAIKFSLLGGSITVSAKEDAHFVTIMVKDKGVGIGREKQKELFSTYTNYSTEGTQGEKGTGLGLILCKEFVEKNGGKIGVESEIGEGSTFWFKLPRNNNSLKLSN